MKPLHIGLLVVGAALAGGLAMRLAAPPPLPARAVTPPRQIKTSPAVSTVVAATAADPGAKEAWVRAPESAVSPEPEVAPAPPAIYSEPVLVAQPGRPKPFPAVPAAPVVRAEPAHVSPIPPVAYQPPPERVLEVKAVTPPVSVPAPVVPAVAEPPAAPRRVSLQAGTPITIRLIGALSTERAAAGDRFQATLADPLIGEGLVVAERGAPVTGWVTQVRRAGRFSGVSYLELRVVSFMTADGQRIAIASAPWLKRGDSMGRASAATIGGGAALGAAIGAFAGGGRGAALGAGAGAGLGAGVQAMTGGRPVTIPSETVIQFRLASPVSITERRL
ncbi:MAG: hypothetical protein KGN84_20510 [Acidobacteriota bacterium]|nr:hypothetical protein [Acidobacteriota bacterium]